MLMVYFRNFKEKTVTFLLTCSHRNTKNLSSYLSQSFRFLEYNAVDSLWLMLHIYSILHDELITTKIRCT